MRDYSKKSDNIGKYPRGNIEVYDGKIPEFVFLGKINGVGYKNCRDCGLYQLTKSGHGFCYNVDCRFAIEKYKLRNRKRTSKLEQEYLSNGKNGNVTTD